MGSGRFDLQLRGRQVLVEVASAGFSLPRHDCVRRATVPSDTTTSQEVRQVVPAVGVPRPTPIARDSMRTLGRSFIESVPPLSAPGRRWWMPLRRKLAFGALLARTIFARPPVSRPSGADQKMVGILLPPSVGGAIANLAALLMGKVPVNLNYTASAEGDEVVRAAVRPQMCRSRRSSFWRRRRLSLRCARFSLDDIVENPSALEKLVALVFARLSAGAMVGEAR